MNVAGREQQPIPGLERQLQLIPEMAAETADFGGVRYSGASAPAIGPRRLAQAHVELDASTIDFAALSRQVRPNALRSWRACTAEPR